MSIECLYGRRPVIEALRAGRRRFRRLVVARGIEHNALLEEASRLARQLRIPHETTRRDELDGRTRDANHQGVMLEVGPYPYADIDEMLALAETRKEMPLVLLLDLLQDVQNVGTLMRAAEAVGAHGVIIQERRAAEVTPAVVSASSGAVEHLLVAQVTNLVRAMEQLKKADVWLAGLDQGDDAQCYDEADLDRSLGLVVGSEGQGLRRLVRETCDFVIRLPMRGAVASLNAATAGTVALYAAWRARGFKGPSR